MFLEGGDDVRARVRGKQLRSTRAAFTNLFAAGMEKSNDQKADDSLNDFLSKNIASYDSKALDFIESQKIGNYVNSVDSLIERNVHLIKMSDRIAANVPKLDKKILEDQYTVVEQQFAFADILLSSLRAGLTNVATFTLDDLGTRYDGVAFICRFLYLYSHLFYFL